MCFVLVAATIVAAYQQNTIIKPVSFIPNTEPDSTGNTVSSETEQLYRLEKNKNGYIDITASQLSYFLNMPNNSLTLINVHIPYEGEIPQTDIFTPFHNITKVENLKRLPAKDSPIVLYCRSGSMSTVAAKKLVEIGFTNVFELDGGFKKWRTAGYEFIK
jgi:rhodanese-related sulfurtransferase